MDFFSNLRQLAAQIEREVINLQEVAEESTSRRRSNDIGDDEDNYGKTRQVLQGLQKEAREYKNQVCDTLKNSTDDGSLLHTINIAGKVVNQQTASVKQLEVYLQQYGYVPLNEDANLDAHNIVKLKENSTEELPMTNIEITSSEKDPSCISQYSSATPQISTIPTPLKKNRTPKLEDYGLSFDKLKMYDKKVVRTQQCETGKSSSSSLGFSCQFSTDTPLYYKSSSQITTPHSFHHNGLCVTPGLQLSYESQASPDLNRTYDSVGDGLKSTPAPELMQRTPPTRQFLSAPVPPVLTTPAAMQASPLPVKPKLNSSEEAGSSTPKAPETTMNFTQMALLANLMANKYQPSSESNIIANEEKDDVEDISIVYPREPLAPVDTSADKYKSNKSSYNSTKFEEEPDLPKRPTLSSVPLLHTPEMPELTTKLPPFDMYKQIDKENTSPSNKGPRDLTLCSRLAQVTHAEYADQPDYLCRYLSLEECNKAIMYFNKILFQKVTDGKTDMITEEELNTQLSDNSKAFILLMQRLQRLSMKEGRDGGIFYRPR